MLADRWEYPRRVLRHMLTVRTADGIPVVCQEAFFRDYLDDLSVENPSTRYGTAEEMAAWAFNDDDSCCDTMHHFACTICQSYRLMVGAFSYAYLPDWMCAQPSPAFGDPSIPAWDRFGRRVV